MTKEVATAAFAFLSYYAKLYSLKYKKQPVINKYKEKWAASSILEDYDKDTAYRVMDYYFSLTKEGHPLGWFFNNFDVLLNSLESSIKDNELRKQRRLETAKLRQEWLNGNA